MISVELKFLNTMAKSPLCQALVL